MKEKVLALLVWRWIHLIRRPRPREARRALLGPGGSLALSALVYAAIVYGLGLLLGFPLQPNLPATFVPEVLVLMGVLEGGDGYLIETVTAADGAALWLRRGDDPLSPLWATVNQRARSR